MNSAAACLLLPPPLAQSPEVSQAHFQKRFQWFRQIFTNKLSNDSKRDVCATIFQMIYEIKYSARLPLHYTPCCLSAGTWRWVPPPRVAVQWSHAGAGAVCQRRAPVICLALLPHQQCGSCDRSNVSPSFPLSRLASTAMKLLAPRLPPLQSTLPLLNHSLTSTRRCLSTMGS